MNLIIDTNVALDLALKRDGFFESSSKAVRFALSHGHRLHFLTSSVTDYHYILKRNGISEENSLLSIKNLASYTSFAPVDEQCIYQALESDITDFEDAVIDAVAANIHADYILTRNKKDFEHSKVKAITPEEFLAL